MARSHIHPLWKFITTPEAVAALHDFDRAIREDERALCEWSWKEGRRVLCASCGVEYRESTIRRKHRPGCAFKALLDTAREKSLL